jgi:hypothetical protein
MASSAWAESFESADISAVQIYDDVLVHGSSRRARVRSSTASTYRPARRSSTLRAVPDP